MQVTWDSFQSPIGELTLAVTEKGLCYLGFHKDGLDKLCHRYFSDATLIQDSEELLPYKTQLNEYFQGKRTTFIFSLDLHGTPFQQQVWTALQAIPYGEVRSYKEVAVSINSPKAVRAVGGANNKNPISIVIPCHRVVGSDGKLVGYGGGLDKKDKLLSLEQKLA